MCGISAIISFEDSDIVSNIFRMTDIIRHRGPDDEGFAVFGKNPSDISIYGGNDTPENVYSCGFNFTPKQKHLSEIHGKVALGHRRLSIIDLSPRGHQPMSYKNRRYWIVYNGEIYNYIEIREELLKRGHIFVSNTDTEVILAAYDEWGEDCLNHFNGMWAFIIYDEKDDVIFAARDRFGVKPLYYWKSPADIFAFASEIKQFTVLPGWRAAANPQRLYDFLVFETADHTGETLFIGVKQLRGGESILCSRMEIFKEPLERLKKKWYRIKPTDTPSSSAEASSRFLDILTDAVKIRLRSDVPVGTGLSGGLDSSSIVCITTNLLRKNDPSAFTNTFSSCSHDPRFDERSFISEVISKTGAAPHYSFPEPDDLLKNIDKLAWLHDEPVLSTSVFAEWTVFKTVAGTPVKVTLDGHGADEILAGYPGFFTPFWRNLLFNIRIAEFLNEIRASSEKHGTGLLSALLRIADISLPEQLRQTARRVIGLNNARPPWLNMGMLGACPADPKSSLPFSQKKMDGMSKLLLFHTSLPVQLHWSDRDSMSNSVESRAPFLDYRLVEFLASCPDKLKISNGSTKAILREAMNSILPEKIKNRQDKVGFVTPEENWMKRHPKSMEIFKEAISVSSRLFTDSAFHKAESIISGGEKFNFFIWRVISLGSWIKAFNVKICASQDILSLL